MGPSGSTPSWRVQRAHFVMTRSGYACSATTGHCSQRGTAHSRKAQCTKAQYLAVSAVGPWEWSTVPIAPRPFGTGPVSRAVLTLVPTYRRSLGRRCVGTSMPGTYRPFWMRRSSRTSCEDRSVSAGMPCCSCGTLRRALQYVAAADFARCCINQWHIGHGIVYSAQRHAHNLPCRAGGRAGVHACVLAHSKKSHFGVLVLQLACCIWCAACCAWSAALNVAC